MMSAIDALLPTYESSRGLSAVTLARCVYRLDRQPTRSEEALIERAAQRLVRRGVADNAFVAHVKVYFRAKDAAAPGAGSKASADHDESVVIVRSIHNASSDEADR